MADTTMNTGKAVDIKGINGENSSISRFLKYAALIFFTFTILFVHLPLGGAREWAVSTTLILTYITLGLYLISCLLRGYFKFSFSPLYILFGSLILFAILQISISSAAIPFLNNNYKVWDSLSEYLSKDIYPTISLTPYITGNYLVLFFLSLLIFYLSLELFRKKKIFYLLPVIFLFSIALNSFVGLLNESGVLSERILCYVPARGISIAGTFINRNHFAVFLEMGLCTSLGLLAGTYFSHSVKYRKYLLIFSSLIFCFFIVSILFSYSRAGISISILMLMIFSILLILELKKRKKILGSFYLIILFAVGFCFAAVRGLTYVWERFETTFAADDPSLMGRFEFWETTLAMIKEFWIMGAGFGSFTYVSTRFESGLIPNKIANHAHNDWLELFAEVGVPFALFVIFFILIFYLVTLHRVIRQKSTFKKWLGIGAGLSILSVMLHETVGFALRKPGIMVLLSVLVVIFLRCSQKTPVIRKFKLTGYSKYIFILVILCAFGFLFFKTYPLVSSGYALETIIDRHRSYYSSHTNLSEYDDALYQIELADKVLKTEDNPIAYMIKGQSQYTLAVEILKKDNFRFTKGNIIPVKEHLTSAIENMRISLESYPTRSLYYVRLANCLEFLLELRKAENTNFKTRQLESLVEDTYYQAHYYSPNIGNITRNTAFAKWRMLERRLQIGIKFDINNKDVKEAVSLFRKFAQQSPGETYEIYKVIWEKSYSVQLLYAVTPDYISAHINLYRFLYNKGFFDEAEKELQKIIEINKTNKKKDLSQYDKLRVYDQGDAKLNQFVYREKALLASCRNDWKSYDKYLKLYKENLRIELDEELEILTENYNEKQYYLVYAKLNSILKRDPNYSKSAALAAKTSLQLGKMGDYYKYIMPLLFPHNQVSNEIYVDLLRQLEKFNIFTDLELQKYRFYKSALKYRIYENSSNQDKNEDVISDIENEIVSIIKLYENKKIKAWLNFHLVYFLYGKCLKHKGDYSNALKAYIKALNHTPKALFIINEVKKTLDTMKAEGVEVDLSTKNGLKPYLDCANKINLKKMIDIDYGNICRLYGVSVSKDNIKQMEPVTISYFVECRNIIDREYFLCTNFSNSDRLRFNDIFKPGQDENSDSMLTWKMGEIVEIKRMVKPAVYSLKVKNSLPPTGNYLLNLYFFTTGNDAHSVTPVVNTSFPVFRIEN